MRELEYKVFEQITADGYDNDCHLMAMFYQPYEAVEYMKHKASQNADYDHFRVWIEDEEGVVDELGK